MRPFLLLPLLFLLNACTTRLIYRVSNHTPERAQIVTEDINRFWLAFDSLESPRFVDILDQVYFQEGSRGLRDFDRRRIEGAEKLAHIVQEAEAYYRFIKPHTYAAADYESEIRQSFDRLAELYDDARFPDVYFLIGRLTSGGTLSSKGLLIGTEMHAAAPGAPRDSLSTWLQSVLSSPDGIPAIVAHELIHYQQKYPLRLKMTLMQQSITEGSADFVGEFISGQTINPKVHIYGDAHETELWNEFTQEMYGTDYGRWLYNGNQSSDRPGDLGYYIGYKICEAYFQQKDDPRQAIEDILEIRDFEAFLKASGYKGGNDL